MGRGVWPARSMRSLARVIGPVRVCGQLMAVHRLQPLMLTGRCVCVVGQAGLVRSLARLVLISVQQARVEQPVRSVSPVEAAGREGTAVRAEVLAQARGHSLLLLARSLLRPVGPVRVCWLLMVQPSHLHPLQPLMLTVCVVGQARLVRSLARVMGPVQQA
jgi:hypothetical protein